MPDIFLDRLKKRKKRQNGITWFRLCGFSGLIYNTLFSLPKSANSHRTEITNQPAASDRCEQMKTKIKRKHSAALCRLKRRIYRILCEKQSGVWSD